MQKKLIALAVAGLVSAPVMAQSNVQIYGVMDLGIQHLSSSDTSSLRSRTAIDSGLSAASRIGFRGTEDLGNGLSAFFVIEQGIAADRGTTGARPTFLGLRGGFGQVSVGRQFTPERNFIVSMDPFADGTVGQISHVYGFVGQANNLAIYQTPNMNGFRVDLAYSNAIGGNEEVTLRGVDRDNDRYWSITPTYRNGPLTAGLNYSQLRNRFEDAKVTQWDLGGSYDFGVAKLSALYGQNKLDVSGAPDVKYKNWMIGATIPVSEAGKVMASYIRGTLDVSGASDAKANQWALGYEHSLSKRTHLYAAYAKISTNSAAEGAFSVGGRGGVDANDFTSGLNLGVRHHF